MTLQYLELDDGSKEIPNNLLAGLLRIRHPANPDFIDRYASVVRWYAEFETESRRVVREIGLNPQNEPVVLGPFGRNDGLWTGLSFGVNVDASPRIDKRVFNAAWEKLAVQYRDRVPPKQTAPRLPVTTERQLLGLWSADSLCGPGSMSDQLIAFLAEGRGFFENVNVTTTSYDRFRWKLVGKGAITIIGETHHYIDEASHAAQVPSEFTFARVRADIQTHFSGDGSSIEVLYIPLRDKPKWLPGVYGRCPVPPPEIQFPSLTQTI
jgi:hypothetical protein